MGSDPDQLTPNLAEAERFLELLDPEADSFTFQTFAEEKDKHGNKRGTAQVQHGTLQYHADFLDRAQRAGCYVGYMVQEGDGKRHPGEKTCRTIASVKRVRAIFQEDDGDGKPVPLEPHVVVESSPGKHHRYWLCEGLSTDDFAAVMDVMVHRHGSDKNAKDLARVLRLPGFLNRKYETPFMVRIIHESGAVPYTRDQIMNAFKPEPVQPNQAQPEPDATESVSVDASMIAKVTRIAIDAALRTLNDPNLGRHSEIYEMGHRIRRDLFPRGTGPDDGSLGKLLDTALKTFNQHMRQTDTSGRTVGMDWENESKALFDAFTLRSGEPDRPGTRTGDFEDIVFDAGAASNDDPEPEPESEQSRFPEPFPGFMADVVNRALESAAKPQPNLTTLAVLLGMAASICGHYRMPDGMRLNLYGVGAAETGTGKDHPQKVAQAIVKAAGGRVIGKPSSGQGLEDALEDYAAMLVTIDEVAHMFESINGANKTPYLVELASILLKLHSDSRGTYYGRVLAKVKGAPQYRNIEHPCVSLLGYATPEKLGEALTIGNLEDGLAGRLLFAVGDPDVPPRRVRRSFELGDRHADASAVGAFSQVEINGTTINADFGKGVLQIDPVADAELDRLLQSFHLARMAPNASAHAKALYARSYENAYRVAGVLAVFDNPAAPVIRLDHIQWAERLVMASNEAIVTFVVNHMHGNRIQVDAARVKDVISKIQAGKLRPQKLSWKGYLPGHVVRSWALKASHLDKRSFDFAIEHLEALDEVVAIQAKDGKIPALLKLGGAE